MSFDNQKLRDYLYEYKRSVEKNLTDEEKKTVDEYIEKTSETMDTVLELVEKLTADNEMLANLKKETDKFMEDEKWLEKLLRTSSTQ